MDRRLLGLVGRQSPHRRVGGKSLDLEQRQFRLASHDAQSGSLLGSRHDGRRPLSGRQILAELDLVGGLTNEHARTQADRQNSRDYHDTAPVFRIEPRALGDMEAAASRWQNTLPAMKTPRVRTSRAGRRAATSRWPTACTPAPITHRERSRPTRALRRWTMFSARRSTRH